MASGDGWVPTNVALSAGAAYLISSLRATRSTLLALALTKLRIGPKAPIGLSPFIGSWKR